MCETNVKSAQLVRKYVILYNSKAGPKKKGTKKKKKLMGKTKIER
jgi:hypothetical protein